MLSNCKCPKCKNKMLIWKTVLPNLDYVIECVWCHWESNKYKDKKEAVEKYEDEVF